MISCSAEFKALWHKKQGKPDHQRIGYKRRFKSGGVYQNETAFTYLYRPDFISLGDMPQQIDAQFQNIVTISVITLTFPNLYNEWIETAVPPSFFAADASHPNGFKAFKTIWQIQEGMELSDGTIEWITVFTGLGMRPRITGGGAEAQVDVSSYAMLLEMADAEAVSEEPAIENCIPPTGDGTNVKFESTSTGVDHAKSFLVDDAGQNRGLGYRVSNANEVASAGNTGRLLFTAGEAPGAGISIKCQVFRWLLNKSVDYLLGALATVAGITAGMRTIIPIIFPGGLSASKTIDTQDEWEAADTAVNVSTLATPGSSQRKWMLIDDFSDGNYTANPAWSAPGMNGTIGVANSVLVSGGRLVFYALAGPGVGQASTAIATLPFDAGIVGTWEQKLTYTTNGAGSGITLGAEFRFNGSMSLVFDGNAGTVKLRGSAYVVAVDCGAIPAGEHTWRVTRATDGSVEVFKDGVSVGTGTVADYTPTNQLLVQAYAARSSGLTSRLDIDDLYFSVEVDGVGAVSNSDCEQTFIFDLLSAPSAMGILEVLQTLNGGTILIKTAGAEDLGGSPPAPGTFDALVERDVNGVMQHTPKRWLKIYVKITPSLYNSPQLHRIIANFSTTDVFVSLANHRGRNVLQQMEKYVALADYEMRFRGDGTLYIGPKNVSGEPALELDQENGIIDIGDLDTGIPNRIVRGGRVRYGGFVSKYDDVDAGIVDAEILADGEELGDSYKDENLDGTILANDVNIGDSRARLIYERGRRAADDPRPPLRLPMEIWDAPWLEVSDIIRASYHDHPIMKQLVAYDELLRIGPYANFGEPANIITSSKDWKLIYYNPNKDTSRAKILLEEIPA